MWAAGGGRRGFVVDKLWEVGRGGLCVCGSFCGGLEGKRYWWEVRKVG